MANESAVVIMVNRPGTEGPAIEKELREAGHKVDYVPAELTDIAECKRVIDDTAAKYCRIDVVNNAGGNNQKDLLTPPEEFMTGLRDNLIHYYALVHYARLSDRRFRGDIVNIGSHVAITGQGRTAPMWRPRRHQRPHA